MQKFRGKENVQEVRESGWHRARTCTTEFCTYTRNGRKFRVVQGLLNSDYPLLRKKQKMKTQNFHVGVPLSLTRICFSIFMMRLVHFSASYYLVVRRANKFFKDYFSQTRDDFLRTFDLKFSGLAEYVNKNFPNLSLTFRPQGLFIESPLPRIIV